MESLLNAACSSPSTAALPESSQAVPQLQLLDFFFPGFSVFSTAFHKYLGVDLNVYIPLVLLCGGATFAWRYFSEYLWSQIETHLMSTVEVRTDDEIYNILMSWVAAQRFAKNSRRFVVNTNLNSRSWFLWRWEDDDEEEGDSSDTQAELNQKKKPLSYTPSFGSHTFWFKGHLLLFNRTQNQQQSSFLVVSEREEISISCFGRNPRVLKELLIEARLEYLKKDSQKTMIYRGTTRAGTTEPTWQRSMARTSRPFSTVILNEKLKKQIVDDVSDYLSPATRKWYSNRGIPWRRGYLLTGPPGTGKSSLSLALAGYFKMRIYMVSLSSFTANEENLASLFAELPRRCVVLLEDIDTAGLTHTREATPSEPAADSSGSSDAVPGQVTAGSDNSNNTNNTSSRLSLSGLLNILDGVASQEGRVLIMTTNHVEKLDKALIRPGRVDMIVKFSLADEEIIGSIFRAIYAPLEGDESPNDLTVTEREALTPEATKLLAEEEAKRIAGMVARVDVLSHEFVSKIPAHEFSPAEIQGFLLKHKRTPETAVADAAQWVIDTRKEKKEKELKAAEEKREAEKKKKEEEEKKKKEEEEEKKKKEEEEKKEREEKKKEEEKGTDDKKGEGKSEEQPKEKADEKNEAKEEVVKKEGANKEDNRDENKGEEGQQTVESSASSEVEEETTKVKKAKPARLDLDKDVGVEEGKHGTDSGYGTPAEVDS